MQNNPDRIQLLFILALKEELEYLLTQRESELSKLEKNSNERSMVDSYDVSCTLVNRGRVLKVVQRQSHDSLTCLRHFGVHNPPKYLCLQGNTPQESPEDPKQ